MKFNWTKMYDKGTVLRVETVINNPEEFRVRRRVRREIIEGYARGWRRAPRPLRYHVGRMPPSNDASPSIA
jgi:hypothetical protein